MLGELDHFRLELTLSYLRMKKRRERYQEPNAVVLV